MNWRSSPLIIPSSRHPLSIYSYNSLLENFAVLPTERETERPTIILSLSCAGGRAESLQRPKVPTPPGGAPRRDHGLRSTRRSPRQGRLRPHRGQEIPHPRQQRRDQTGTDEGDGDPGCEHGQHQHGRGRRSHGRSGGPFEEGCSSGSGLSSRNETSPAGPTAAASTASVGDAGSSITHGCRDPTSGHSSNAFAVSSGRCHNHGRSSVDPSPASSTTTAHCFRPTEALPPTAAAVLCRGVDA